MSYEDMRPISPGDRVQQIAPFGLSNLDGFHYVVAVKDGGKLNLAKEPSGPPLTDLRGNPRDYPRHAFRKVTWNI